MFEVPEAKRVKRSKIFSQSSSTKSTDSDEDELSEHLDLQRNEKSRPSASSSVTENQQNEQSAAIQRLNDHNQINYGFEYDFIEKIPVTSSTSQNSLMNDNQGSSSKIISGEKSEKNDEDDHREQTYEFLLFKPTSKRPSQSADNDAAGHDPGTTNSTTTVAAVNRITVRSPTPESQRSETSGSILKPRPHSYYFTSHIPERHQQQLKAQYLEMAISGAKIKEQAAHPWPGTYLPWRVTHIKTSHTGDTKTQQPQKHHPGNGAEGNSVHVHRTSRARPSKKRRILNRQRIAIRLSAQIAAVKEAEMKEEFEREKRTKRNREKKVKRKEREKRKKVTEPGDGELVQNTSETGVDKIRTGSDEL